MDEKQAVDLLWDEWKYRHDLFWRLLFQWAGSVVALWIIPFLKPDIFKPYPKAALVFPLLAFFLTLLSAWLLGAEQRRFEMVSVKYDELRQGYLPPRMPKKTFADKLFAARVGASVVWFYGLTFALVSLAVAAILLKFIEQITSVVHSSSN
jgi:hypothetical protein